MNRADPARASFTWTHRSRGSFTTSGIHPGRELSAKAGRMILSTRRRRIVAEPRHHLVGVLIGRKDRIEHVRDSAGSDERLIVAPFVAGRAREGSAIPRRCRAPPSSDGGGMLDQSGVSMLLAMSDTYVEGLPSHVK